MILTMDIPVIIATETKSGTSTVHKNSVPMLPILSTDPKREVPGGMDALEAISSTHFSPMVERTICYKRLGRAQSCTMRMPLM